MSVGEVLKEESIEPAPESGRTSPSAVLTGSLARLAAAGDRAAAAQLLHSVMPRLYRAVRAVLGRTHPDLDDALQLSLIGFVQALPAFRGECGPLEYATVIAVRMALATRKRAHIEQHRRGDPPDVESTAGVGSSPEDEVALQRRKGLLRDLLTDLPTEQGEALAMRVMLGCSLREIAEYGHVPLNTVRSRLRLAKEALRRKIEADDDLLDALKIAT